MSYFWRFKFFKLWLLSSVIEFHYVYSALEIHFWGGGVVPRSAIAESYGECLFYFLRNGQAVFQSSCTILTFLLGSVWAVQWLYILDLFYFSHSSRCLVVYCGFSLHFPHYWWCWASHILIGHLLYLLFAKFHFICLPIWKLSCLYYYVLKIL